MYANGHKIGLPALTSVSQGSRNASLYFELRLKINKMVNLNVEYLHLKNTNLRTVCNVICPIPSHTKFWGDFYFFQYFTHFGGKENGRIERAK